MNDRCVFPDGGPAGPFDAGPGPSEAGLADAIVPVEAVPLTADLAAYWPLDKDLRDYGANNLDLSATDVSFASESGPRGGALVRTANSSISQSSGNAALDLLGPFTLQVWFFLEGDAEAVLMKLNTVGGQEGWSLAHFKNDGKISFLAAPGGTFYSDDSVPRDAWVHVVLVSDTKQLKIYTNGKLASAKPATGLVRAATPLYVGQYGLSEKGAGKLDEIAIWNRALGPDDVTTLYAEGRG